MRPASEEFKTHALRWLVERTYKRLTLCRKSNRNYEHTLASSRAVVRAVLIGIDA